MASLIQYATTDLDLVSPHDLTRLAAAFETKGMYALHVTHEDNGHWSATFEVNDSGEPEQDSSEPEPDISVMLDAIESLEPALLAVWQGCTCREFNIGYECGDEPWEFNQSLSNQLLGRMASVAGVLRITIYPDWDRRATLNRDQPTN